MMFWHDDFNGRLFPKIKFLQVRKDPFRPSDVEGLYILRIEVYRETENDRYFGLKMKQNQKVMKEETCLFDDKGRLKIVYGADAYRIIKKSCYKAHIPRDLPKEEANV